MNNHGEYFSNIEKDELFGNFYINPFSTFLDETIFRMDVFETETHYYIEALIPNATQETIKILVKDDSLSISHIERGKNPKKRVVFFPSAILPKTQKITFETNIIEIHIQKKK